MGGSAISGDIAAEVFNQSARVPIIVNRNFALPEFVSEKTLVLAISYSGGTDEVISAVREAEKKQAPIFCVTSGGKLKEAASAKGYPLFLIPSGYQPRAALPFMLLPVITILNKAEIIPAVADEIKETITLLEKLREEYGPHKSMRVNPVKQLAKKLVYKMPVIFGSAGTTSSAAMRLKTQLNENSKVTAMVNYFPELNHNEIVNLSSVKREEHNLAWIVMRDEADNERVKKGIEIIKSLLGKQLGGVNEIISRGKSHLTRIFSLIYFGDFLSVYLALLQGIDPTPVEAITRFKKELTR
jgi:glucose/mannose-6-phosphate isomerase